MPPVSLDDKRLVALPSSPIDFVAAYITAINPSVDAMLTLFTVSAVPNILFIIRSNGSNSVRTPSKTLLKTVKTPVIMSSIPVIGANVI